MRKEPQAIEPIRIGSYTLIETGLEVTGRPAYAEHLSVGEFIRRSVKASRWWLADWLRYGETRPDWRERLELVMDVTEFAEKTLRNVKYVGENVAPSRRREDVEFSLHAEVAPLHPKEQTEWLEKAATEGWTLRELRLSIRAAARRRVIDGQAVLEGMYRVIYADNPWLYGDRPPSGVGAIDHYPGMTIEQQCALPVVSHALPNSVLFMWVPAPLLLEEPGPREVGRAWGFTYKQQIIWDKIDGTYSHYTGGNHEVLTIWTRGSCLPDLPTGLPDSVQVHKKTPEHSAKPEEFRRLIEKHWTRGPYLELFGRTPIAGWNVFGNDARLWARQAEEQDGGVSTNRTTALRARRAEVHA